MSASEYMQVSIALLNSCCDSALYTDQLTSALVLLSFANRSHRSRRRPNGIDGKSQLMQYAGTNAHDFGAIATRSFVSRRKSMKSRTNR